MFEFLNDFGNYGERVVDRFEQDNLVVDTAKVSDSSKPFETAVMHPEYNTGNWIIVELYDTEQEAQSGHDKWVKKLTMEELPDQLVDVSTSSIFDLAMSFGQELQRVFKRGS